MAAEVIFGGLCVLRAACAALFCYTAAMHIVIFEGRHWKSFAPLSLSRPVFTLATGKSSLLDKQIRYTSPTRLSLWVRPELADVVRQRIAPKLPVPTTVNQPLDDEPALLVSGRTLHFCPYELPNQEVAVVDEGGIVRSAFVKRPGLSPDDPMHRSDRWLALLDLPQGMPQTRLVEYLWDLVEWNEESLIEDFATLKQPSAPKPVGPYHIVDDDNVWLGENVHLKAGVVLDGSKGPVMIDREASIGENSVIQGPCYIAAYATIAPLTLIRPGTTIGLMCKVAGEISNSVMFGYSNKAHYGFLGDSYVGKWVNLGAGTTTSNLKNTYGPIRARGGEGVIDTGRRFLGAMIGDQAKTAIGTRLMAGTYLGFASMVATSGIPPKFIPSLKFVTDKGMADYEIAKVMAMMQAVFARRDRVWDDKLDAAVVNYVAGLGELLGGAV